MKRINVEIGTIPKHVEVDERLKLKIGMRIKVIESYYTKIDKIDEFGRVKATLI